ncbi:MAG: DUF4304 domain-containing protein [Clostridia bacterium]|nr:DUF4304 domain-containing protein [Clostridia bacterium]
MFFKSKKAVDTTATINQIENAVYEQMKKYGFRKFGRTLHRFVSGDMSQVINFQCGQAYRDETHLMWVNVGIRVPECVARSFDFENTKKYYHEYDCNIRTRLGAVKSRDSSKTTTFDLRKNTEKITREITAEIIDCVLPVFDLLSSRQAVLEHRREYPYFDTTNSHLILLEEAMIYGHLGEIEKAAETFELYYTQARQEDRHIGHIEYLDELRKKLKL